MSEARFLNVEHRVANLENESVRDGNAIERLKKEDAVLENDISTLLFVLQVVRTIGALLVRLKPRL